MIPIKTTIKGFGPYGDEVVIDWSALRSPVAIVAEFGTGKTFLVEAITGCLYGEMPWYSGSLYDALTLGGTGEGLLSVEFEHGGKRYLAERKVRDTGKTRTTKAMLYDLETGKEIAGPKVGDFERVIETLIGPKEVALGTWFLSQNRKADLIGQPGEPDLVARRRAVFNELIGASALDATEKRFAETARRGKTVAEELEAQLVGEPDPTAEIAQEQATLDASRAQLDKARQEIAKCEEASEEAQKRLRDAEGGDDVLRAQVAEYERAAERLTEVREQVAALETRRETLKRKVAEGEKAKADVERLAKAQGERATLLEQQEAWKAWQKWERESGRLADALGSAASMVDSLERFPGADDETRALAGRLDELREQYANALEENKAREATNAEREKTRLVKGCDINTGAWGIKKARERLDRKPETLFGEKCNPCPLVREWDGLPEDIASYERNLREAEAALATIPANEPLINLAELRAEGTRAADALKQVTEAEGARERLEQARATLREAQVAEKAHHKNPPEQVTDPGPDLEKVQTELDDLAGAPERLKTSEEARLELEKILREFNAAKSALAEKTAQERASHEKAKSAIAALKNREQQRTELREQAEKSAGELRELRREQETATRAVARADTRIGDLKRRQSERAEKDTRAKGLRRDLAGLGDLRTCFGPRGVRQILMDAAAPDLEEIAADLFARATGGKQSLRIATQKILADGSTAEDFAIMIADEKGERDALRYSGGQLQLIIILFRIAVSLWIAKAHGQRAECLFLDEAFDRLGAEGAEDLLRVLEHLGDMVSLIVVVTHDRHIAEQLGSQIGLTRHFSGVTVQVA